MFTTNSCFYFLHGETCSFKETLDETPLILYIMYRRLNVNKIRKKYPSFSESRPLQSVWVTRAVDTRDEIRPHRVYDAVRPTINKIGRGRDRPPPPHTAEFEFPQTAFRTLRVSSPRRPTRVIQYNIHINTNYTSFARRKKKNSNKKTTRLVTRVVRATVPFDPRPF